MTTRDFLQYSDLITDLEMEIWILQKSRETQRHEYHVFPTFHKFFVDDFAGVVFARIDVDSLLDNSIGSAAERPSGSILFVSGLYSEWMNGG